MTMVSIISFWQQYFEKHHEGLGTTYERFILHRYFEKIKNTYKTQSVLEAPSFGMTGISGINSMWWASEGAQVTIVDHSNERIELIKKVWQEVSVEAEFFCNRNGYTSLPYKNKSFDMGWNFAALWFVTKLDIFLKELTRVSREVIFICVPNKLNIFHILRSIFEKNCDGIYSSNINSDKIQNIMLKYEWQVKEKGYLDVPPWPDIAMSKEDLLQKIGLKWLANKLKNKGENYICILDYFSGKKKAMDREILKYSFLEDSPKFFKKFWAHHQYFIFVPITKQ